MGDFGMTPPREAVSWRRRQREEEEYMESVHRGVLAGAYVEEPRRGRTDIEEKMDVAAVGGQEGRP